MTKRITAEEVADALRRAREAIEVKPGDPMYPLVVAIETAVLHFGYERSWLDDTLVGHTEQIRLAIVGAQAAADNRVIGSREGIRLEVAKQETTLAEALKASTDRAVTVSLPWLSRWVLLIGAGAMLASATAGRYSGVREAQAATLRDGSGLVAAASQSGSGGGRCLEHARSAQRRSGGVGGCLPQGRRRAAHFRRPHLVRGPVLHRGHGHN